MLQQQHRASIRKGRKTETVLAAPRGGQAYACLAASVFWTKSSFASRAATRKPTQGLQLHCKILGCDALLSERYEVSSLQLHWRIQDWFVPQSDSGKRAAGTYGARVLNAREDPERGQRVNSCEPSFEEDTVPQSCNCRGHILPWDCMRLAPCQLSQGKCKEHEGKRDQSGGVWLKVWGFSAGSLRTLHAFLLPFPVVQPETSMVKEMVNQCQSTFTANSSKYQKVGVSETFHFSRHQRLPLNSCTA